MHSQVPLHLVPSLQAVESRIRAAFRGVHRTCGVSWTQSISIDLYEDSAQAAARPRDLDTCWEDLVDDPRWNDEPGVGGFCFLDAIGFKYYIAPAMIRSARRGGGEFTCYALESHDRVAGFTPAQSQATAHFVRFMMTVHEAIDDPIFGDLWRQCYQGYWHAFGQTQSTPEIG